jgi:hypothetical protein
MCDPSITLKKLYDPKLFTELGPTSDYVVGEILYMYTDDIQHKAKFLDCLQVVENGPVYIKFLDVNRNVETTFRKEIIGYISKKFVSFRLFRENIFTKRQEFVSVLEGTEPNDESQIERYLRSPDNMREISQYLGGKKYRKKNKRTKRTNKTNKTNKINRKKRTRRR